MYHALLTTRYLTSRVIPLVAVAAVGLCVALVIIVVSVMTGFLDMVRTSGRTLMGDVIISYPVRGIPYYERLIERIEALPEAFAATPVVDGWGLVRMPYPEGDEKETQTVQVWGIEGAGFARVTGYDSTLYWRPLEPEQLDAARPTDFRREIGQELLQQTWRHGLALENPRSELPAAVLGIHVSVLNQRLSDGSYSPRGAGYWWMPTQQVTLTLLPVAGGGFIDPTSRRFQVVNEFLSGVFLIDEKRIMIPLAVAQEMLHMDAAERVEDGAVIGIDPARATLVLVGAAPGVTADALRDAVERAYRDFAEEIDEDSAALVKPPALGMGLAVLTWEQQQARFIGPVEKERELMRTLFSLVYLVCAGLVLAIFWAIVYEKTRDIGILRSVGASRLGIAWIFVRYGFIIGVLGAIVGLGLGVLVVRNINTIHDALAEPPLGLAIAFFVLAACALAATVVRSLSGRLLPLVLGSVTTLVLAGCGGAILYVIRLGGIVVWDPAVYYFAEVPNTVDFNSAAITMVGAVIFSLLGAFLPAARAADTDPVTALRYE